MLHRLMGGAVLTETDGIVGPDVDDRHFHQRAEAQRRAAIVGEDQETRGIRPESGERHAVRDGAHGVLPHAEMKVAAAVATVVFGCSKSPAPVECQPCLGGGPQVRRPTQQPGHSRGDGVEHLARRIATGDALGSGGKVGRSRSQPARQGARAHLIELAGKLGVSRRYSASRATHAPRSSAPRRPTLA